MIKRILVPTDGSDSAELGVRYAAALAGKCGASLEGLYVVDIKLLEGPFLRDVAASLGTTPYVNYQGHIAMILEERGKGALDSFESICRQAAVEYDTAQVTGIVTRRILEASELADLIVMGRAGEHTQWLDGLVGSTTEGVVRRADRPVLVTGTEDFRTSRFLAAYDGSRHSRKALQVAANVAGDWGAPLDVLAVEESERAQGLLAEAKEYLESRKLAVNYVARDGDPSEIIVEHAGQIGASLLVMGAYGHTKVRELVVGSTTAYAMNHAPCPLLLTR